MREESHCLKLPKQIMTTMEKIESAKKSWEYQETCDQDTKEF